MSMLLSVCYLLSAAINKIEPAPKLGHVLFDPLSYEANLTRRSNEMYDSRGDWLEESLRMPANKENKEKTTMKTTMKTTKKTTKKTTNKTCLGYDYDDTLCKTVDDRIICGYNKNKGNISDKISDVGNGCRIRGGRLECGYLVGPFNNPRRPPARDVINDDKGKRLNLRYGPMRSSEIPTVFTSTNIENNYTLNVTLDQSENTTTTAENRSNSTISDITNLPVISTNVKTNIINKSTVITSPHMNLSSKSRRRFNATKLKRYCVEKTDRIFCYFMKP